ncbi:hypothetical protein ACSQ67_025829 [Phaseolus vulgaris]
MCGAVATPPSLCAVPLRLLLPYVRRRCGSSFLMCGVVVAPPSLCFANVIACVCGGVRRRRRRLRSSQRLPFSQAIVLNSTVPIMASIMARVFLHDKLKVADIASLACCFFGVLFFFREMLATEGHLVKAKEASNAYAKTGHNIFAILLGIFSSIMGGTSYCLIRAGAKASDQPLLTVFSFGLFASPAMGICTFIFEDFVLPGFQSILLMLVNSIMAFFAEVLLARGLQLERTGKVANIQYLEAALRQLWSLALTRVVPSFDRLVGVSLIVISVSCTMYIGPDKEME